MENEKSLRELEIWIAEKVFGAEITHTPSLATDAYMQTESDKRLMMSAHRVPHYTTESDAAMAVLAKCCEETMMEDCVYVGKTEQEWIVGHTTRNFEEVADTLPLAICKFAQTLFKK